MQKSEDEPNPLLKVSIAVGGETFSVAIIVAHLLDLEASGCGSFPFACLQFEALSMYEKKGTIIE